MQDQFNSYGNESKFSNLSSNCQKKMTAGHRFIDRCDGQRSQPVYESLASFLITGLPVQVSSILLSTRPWTFCWSEFCYQSDFWSWICQYDWRGLQRCSTLASRLSCSAMRIKSFIFKLNHNEFSAIHTYDQSISAMDNSFEMERRIGARFMGWKNPTANSANEQSFQKAHTGMAPFVLCSFSKINRLFDERRFNRSS